MIKTTHIKRLFLIFTFVAVTILFSGCLSSEERAEGRKNVYEAKPYLKEYVKDNYGKSAKIKSYSYVTWTRVDSTVALIDVNISSCVTAKVQTDDYTFTVLYDLNTGEYRSDEYLYELKAELLRLVQEEMGFTGAVACEINFQDEILDVDNLLPVDIKPENLAELYRNVVYNLDIMVYCIDGDWNKDNFSSEVISNKLGTIPFEEEKALHIYVLNLYDQEHYDELMSLDNTIWFTSTHLVELDGNSVIPSEQSYIGEYASAAYFINESSEELKVYLITEKSIIEN